MLKPDPSCAPDNAIEIAFIHGVPWVTVRGPISAAVGDRLVRDTVAFLELKPVNQLILDFRMAALVEDAIGVIRRVGEIESQPLLRQARIAVICTARNSAYSFLETTARRFGLDLRVLTDSALALEWLGA